MTIYNNFKEVIGMPEAKKAVKPKKAKKLTGDETRAWQHLINAKKNVIYKECDLQKHFKAKNLKNFYKGFKFDTVVAGLEKAAAHCVVNSSQTTKQSELNGNDDLVGLGNCKKHISPWLNLFGINDTNPKLKDVFKTVSVYLGCMEKVFSLLGFSFVKVGLYDRFKNACKKLMPSYVQTELDKQITDFSQSVSGNIMNMLKEQVYLKNKFDDVEWDSSSELSKWEQTKDDNYRELKKESKGLQARSAYLLQEGQRKIINTEKQLADLKQRMEVYDSSDPRQNTIIAKKSDKFEKLRDVCISLDEYLKNDPYVTVESFINDARDFEKGNVHEDDSDEKVSGQVRISKDDAKKRIALLKGKHWINIQDLFTTALDECNKASDGNKFNKVAFNEVNKAIANCSIRTQRLILRLNQYKTSQCTDTIIETYGETLKTCIKRYFSNIGDVLKDPTGEKQNVEKFDFGAFKEYLNKNVKTTWCSTQLWIMYCIAYTYNSLRAFIVIPLTNQVNESTDALRAANDALEKPGPSTSKFVMDYTGKFATVAAFTGPLMNLCPLGAAIWAAFAISGTIAQLIQVTYGYIKGNIDYISEEDAEYDKVMSAYNEHLEQQRADTEKGSSDGAREAAEVATDKAIADTTTTTTADLEVKVKKLEEENKDLENQVKALNRSFVKQTAELDKIETENTRLTGDIDKLRKQIRTLGKNPCA